MKKVAIPVTAALLCMALFLNGCAGTPEEKETARGPKQVNAEVLELAKQVLAVVKIELAERDEPLDLPGYDRIEGPRKKGVPIELTGVFVEGGRYVLVPDYGIPLDDFGKVTVHTYDGREYEAEPHSYFMDASAMLLKVSLGEDDEPPPSVVFEEIDPFRFGDSYLVAQLLEEDAVMHVAVTGGSVRYQSAEGEEEAGHFGFGQLGALILNPDGKPVGFAVSARMWDAPQGRTSWRGAQLLRSQRISCEEMKKMLDSLAATVKESVIKLEFTYRDEDSGPSSRYDEYGSKPEELFGLVVDKKGTVFVPQDIDEASVKCIDEIAFRDKDGERHVGAFVGLSKNFGGFVVRFDEMPLVPAVGISPADGMLKGRPFVSAHIVEKRGEIAVLTQFNRIEEAKRIEKSRYNTDPTSREDAGWSLNARLAAVMGNLALTTDGGLVAFISRIKYPDASKTGDDDWRYRRYSPDYGDTARYILCSRIADTLAGAEDQFEEDVKPKTKREGKKVVWLGVEYQGMNKDLAEMMGVKGPTNSGEKGLFVVHVYPDSPAAKLGLKKGDILLEVIPEGKIDQKKELRVSGTHSGYRKYGPSWRDRRNYLTTLLTDIGKETEIELRYVQDKSEKTAKITLELSPPDFETAEKYKDEVLGLTVKNLTYEVRFFAKLNPGDNALVVDKTESGRPMQVALYTRRFLVPEKFLIRKINDVEVKDVQHYKTLMKQFREQKRESLTFVVEHMGVSMVVEVKPDWSEGEGLP